MVELFNFQSFLKLTSVQLYADQSQIIFAYL